MSQDEPSRDDRHWIYDDTCGKAHDFSRGMKTEKLIKNHIYIWQVYMIVIESKHDLDPVDNK